MRIRYSKEADALYIRLSEDEINDTDEINEDIVLDYNQKGVVVGIEILSASEKTNIAELIVQQFGRILVEQHEEKISHSGS